ncbi:MAG: glycosylase [Patescibacteria group bacterium]|nr:glycosylase [Patescibacteria group bacterium]
MYKWKTLGRVFNPQDAHGIAWIKEFAQAPSVLVYDTFVRVYFSGREPADSQGQYISRLAYVDLKRDNLFDIVDVSKKPILPLGNLGTFDEFGTYPASVIKQNDEIRVYYAGWTRCESVPFNAAIGVAISRDGGQTFEKLGPGPILSYSPDEPFVLGSPKIRWYNGRWYLWYVAGKKWVGGPGRPEPVYKIRLAVSADGLDWKKQGQDLIESSLEADECQASPDVFFRDGMYHMYFSHRYNLNFKEKGRGYKIGYASSSDLVHWTCDDTQVNFIPSGQEWDSDSVSYSHVFELDDQLYMFYQGNEVGKTGFGLAVSV